MHVIALLQYEQRSVPMTWVAVLTLRHPGAPGEATPLRTLSFKRHTWGDQSDPALSARLRTASTTRPCCSHASHLLFRIHVSIMAASIHHKGWLPREGFHADVLGGLAKKTLLHPLLIHPLYLYFALAPRGRQIISERPRLFKSIRLLAILAALRAINNWLNKRSLNNSATDNYGWDQDKELVIVTGGSDGIGSRIVQGLAERNIRVVVLDVQPLTYDRPKSVSYYACDLNDANAIEDACGQIIQNLGHPTVLINNAGVCTGKNILATTDSDLRLTFGVNALAHYRLARHLLPSMIERDHGMIVTIASSAGWVTAPRMTEYAASKAAAISFHEGLTSELSTFYNAKRVRTVLVCQGCKVFSV